MRNAVTALQEPVQDTPRRHRITGVAISPARPEQVVAAPRSQTLPSAKLLALLHAVEMNIPSGVSAPMMLFLGTHRGAGADLVAFEASYAAALSGKHVLFIDTNASRSDVIRKLREKIPAPLNMPRKDDVEGALPFVNVQGTSLCFTAFQEYEEGHAAFPDSHAHAGIIDGFRNIFDLIVAYSETGLSKPLAAILSGLAEASIIVAEEGRTRAPAITELRRLVGVHGGRAAGLVLNKCMSPVPRFVREALF